jgi:GNAT superfamily N-acetyltransferase
MSLTVVSYAERPELWQDTEAVSQAVWPEYNHHGDVLNPYWWKVALRISPEYQLVLCDEHDDVLAEGHTVPCAWDVTTEGLGDGIDAMIAGAFEAREATRRLTTLGALAAEIKPQFQGRGLADRPLDAMADIARDAGVTHLIAPVRPSFPAGLAPLDIDHRRDLGSYWEPNVWIVHSLAPVQRNPPTR